MGIVTYKILKQAFVGFSIESLKRAALTIFGVDEEADGGRGLERKFSLNGAWLVYLCLILVREHNMTLKQAFTYVWEIDKVLTEKEIVPSILWNHTDKVVPHIILQIFPNETPPVYGYIIYEGGKKEPEIKWKSGEASVNNVYTLRCVPTDRIGDLVDDTLPGPMYKVLLTAHLGHFINTLRPLV